eukprot:SAG31_NODE_6092_length_2174_cov_26.087711_1_plen_336_part_00
MESLCSPDLSCAHIDADGEAFADENFSLEHAGAGVLSMSNSGRHTNKSQFFITFTHTEWLDRQNVAFGQIVDGYDVLAQLQNLPVKSLQGVPYAPVTIADCGVVSEGDAKEPEPMPAEPVPEGPAPIVVAVAGPSGVGKGTLINKLMDEKPGKFGFSVSHTTRDPRPGEIDGVHYNFTTKEKMKTMIAAGEFIEHAEVHGNFYGTSRQAVQSVCDTGKVCILDIDVQGVKSVNSAWRTEPKPLFLFIQPPSMQLLEDRLRGRGTEDEAKIAKRMAGAQREMDFFNSAEGQAIFDQSIINDDLDVAYSEFKAAVNPLVQPKFIFGGWFFAKAQITC